MLVGRFVFVGDAVEIEPVGNLYLLETFDAFPRERSNIMLFDVLVVLALGFEIPL